MKNVSTGFGLCVAAAAALAYPFVSSLAPNANAVGIGTTAVTAVAAAATAQVDDPPAPTIVWYGMVHNNAFAHGVSNSCPLTNCARSWEYSLLARAWSDGRVEAKKICSGDSCSSPMSAGGWVVVNDPAQGLTFDADLNFDEAVDGVDLGMLLAKWGPAPRNPVPPSDCPLALINP